MATPFIITLDSITVNAVIQGGTTITLPIYNHTGLSVNWGITNLDTIVYASYASLTDSNITLDSTTFPQGTSYPVNATGVNFTVTITGNFTKFGAETPPTNWVPESLVSIVQWGSAPIEDLSYACYNASSLISLPTTLPSTVTNVSYMFYSSASPIYFPDSSWDVSGVTDFDFFISGNSGSDATLSNQNSPFSKAAMKMSFSSAISTLPISGIEGNIGIDWGDGNMTYADGVIPAVPQGLFGTVTVYVYGKFSTFSGQGSNYTQFLIGVYSWGKNNTILTNLSYAFAGAGDLTIVPSELPSSVTNVEGMFQNIYATFTPQGGAPTQYSSWNMSNVTSLNSMFDALYFDTSPSSITNNPPEIGPLTIFGQTISTNTKRSIVTDFTVRYEHTGAKYDSTRTWTESPFYTEPMELLIAGGSGFSGPLELPISGIIGSITVVWVESGVGGTLDTIQATYANGASVSFPSGISIPSAVFTVRVYGYFTNFSVDIDIGSATEGWPGSEALNNISAFGKNPDLTSLKGAFAFCNSLATGPPVALPTSVTNLSYLYYKANPTNQVSVPPWNTANVTDVAFAFAGSSIQIQNIALWDISGINTYGKFAFFITDQTGDKDLSISSNDSPFKDKAMAITVLSNYQGAIQLSDIGIDGIAIDYNEGSGAQYVGSTDPVPAPFFTLSSVNGTIYIYGSFGHFGAPDLSGHSSAQYITGITSWGTSNLTSLANAFNGGFNGGGSASTYANDQSNINLPSLPSTVTNLSGMFANCPCAITGISSWDLSGVTNTSYMFYQARNESGVPGKSRFDTDIALWQVNYVTNMDYMFDGAYKFARNISLWDTTGITSTPSFFFSTLTNNLTFDEFSSPAVVDTTTTDLFSPFYVIPPSMTLTFNTSGYVDLPIAGTFTVDWGNGVLNNNTSGTQAGQVKIRGTVTKFGNESDTWPGAAGLTALAGWGDVSGLVSLSGAFNAATSLVSIPTTLPSTVTNLSNMFSMASFFNGDISGWNTAAVTNMSYMFNGALSFNQDITGWDTGAVTNMSHMFSAASAFDKNLTDWDTGSVINMSSMFRDATAQYSNGVLKYNYSGWSVSSVTNRTNFLYINGVETTTTDTNSPFYPQVVQPSMTLTFNGPGIVTLPIAGTFTVDWGDGVLTNSASATLSAAGTVKIRGTVTKFGNEYDTWPGADRLTALTGWENVSGLINLSGAFKEATSLTSVPATLPSTVINLSYMFNEALSFNGIISGWNTAAVTNMSYMFAGATLFNGNITGWDTGAVTDMAYMFAGALAFNQILSDWDTGAVTNMEGMFRDATAFNGNISDWYTGFVTNMMFMFRGATAQYNNGLLKYDYSEWSVSSVTNSNEFLYIDGGDKTTTDPYSPFYVPVVPDEPAMTLTFMLPASGTVTLPIIGNYTVDWGDGVQGSNNATGTPVAPVKIRGTVTQFGNGSASWTGAEGLLSLSGWGDVSGLVNLSGAFNNAFSLSSVPTTLPPTVTNLSYMFKDAGSFDQSLSTWNTRAVTDMSHMFDGAMGFKSNIFTDVSGVINMSYMFKSATSFDKDISSWNTIAVKNMSYMFDSATAFNQNISTWNTGAVTTMEAMFKDAEAFNQNISSWNTGAVTNMGSMFSGTAAFNQNISTWNTGSVTDMSYMFDGAIAFNQNISDWDTGAVTYMTGMFLGATAFNQNLSTWNVSNIGTYGQFQNFFTDNFNGNTSDVSISSNRSPFRAAAMAITVLPTFTDAIQVSDIGPDGIAIDYNDGYGAMEYTYSTPVLGPTFTGFTSGPIYIYGSFGHFGAPDLSGHPTAQHITGITRWGTSNNNLTSLANAFNGGFNGGGTASTYANDLVTINLPPLPSTVTDLTGMFANCPCVITTGISSWDLSGVTNTSYMFYQARSGTGVPGKSRFNVNITGWRTSVSNVTNMDYMFDGAYEFERNISLWVTTGITSPPPFFFSTLTNNPTFDEASTPTVADTTISDFKSPFFNGTPPEGSMTLVFSTDTQTVILPIEGIYTVNWGNGNPVPNDPSGTPIGSVIITGNVTRFGNGSAGWIGADGLLSLSGWESMTTLVNISGAFNFAINLTSVPTALPDGVTNLSYLFNDAALFNQNLSTWDTGAITNMSNMFSSTPAFNQDLSTWDTGAVTNMSNMFGGATAFNQDLHTWNTESVINMAGMFSTATLFNGDISGWNTGAVKNMSGMFQNATSFDQDLTTWNTESVTDMSFMFQYATAFNSDLSGWNTGAVTNMRGMFDGATAFNGNISTWNTELVTNMSYMFYGATAFNGDLTSDLTSWDTGAVTNMSYMFRGATAFAGYGLESWNTGSVTNMSHMFENAATVGNVFDTWNVSNVTDMSYMFKGAIGIGSPSYLWNVSKVVDMSHMFEGTFIELNAGSWKPKRCANFSYMFAGVDLTNVASDITLAPWASYIGISAEQIGKVNFMTEGTDDITNLTPISPFWADPNGTNAPKSYVADVGRGGFPMAISFLCSAGTYLSLPISNQDGEVLIDWGDGQVNWYPPEFTGVYEHYTRISNPEIQLYANFNNFGANLWAGVNKVVSVDGWGSPNKLINFSNAFKGATILTAVPSILPTTARNLFSMFKGTVLFNQDLSGWDVSRVTDFSDMFFQSIAFGGTGLGKWKPRAAQDMSRMFSGATAFNTNLKPWCAYLGVLTGPVSHINFFTGSDTTNPNSPWYTGYTTAPSRNPLTITFQPTPYTAQNPLIFPPNVSGTAYISLPITGVSGDLFIDWGDGTKNLYSQNQQPILGAWTEVYEHVDLSGSNHQVKIYGDFATFGERYNGDAKLSTPENPAVVWFGLSNVLTVDSWGDNAILSSLKQAFQLSAFSLTAVPSNIPRTVKNTASMFLATPLFVGANLALWDVSGLTNTTSMFAGAAAFTADLSGWAYKLGPVSAYDNFFSTTTYGMSGFTDPTSQSPRSPFYIGVPTPSNPYVPAAPLVVFNAQPNPTIKVGTEVFGTVGSVLYSLNPSYTRITDLGISTFVGTLYRPYIANVSISNKIYGAHTGGKLISYDTVTRTLDLSAGSYQGIPTGYMVLDTNGNLYSTDSAGYVYKLAYATPTFVALNTAALVPPVIGPLSIVNDEFLYGADSNSRLVRLSLPAIDVVRSEPIDMAPTSLIVDSAVKSYFYDTSGQALWSYSPLTKLHDFSGNPLDGTGPVGPIRMDPTKRVLYGICSAGGRGIGTGLRGAGTLFSFDLSSSEYSVLVNYVAGDVNRGETPLDFSITTETGTAFVTTRSSSTSFQTRIAPRVANGFGVNSAELPGATTTCFNHGTKILSLINDIEAWVPVESLNIGDLVMTYLHGPRPITHIFKGVMINNPAIWHTCMYKGQKAGFEPLLVTGGHGLLVDYLTEKEQAKQQKFWGRNEVVIDDKIVILAPVSAEFTQIKDRDIYTYYHFVVENDGDDDRRYGVYANGFLTETPSKNQANSKNFKDHPVY